MLPQPATSRGKARIYFPSLPPPHQSTPSQLFNHLRARTRLTNLAVSLITFALILSTLLNTRYLLFGTDSNFSRGRGGYRGSKGFKGSTNGWDLASLSQLEPGVPLSIETTIERDVRYTELDHLIMVPGHAIWIGNDPSKAAMDDQWILEPMQKGGSVKTYRRHIEEAVERLRGDPQALLMFSGGATRHPPSPPIPESLSYLSLAHSLSLLPSTPLSAGADGKTPLPLNLRAATEEYALDSYENLLFSLARFHEVTGRYPERVTVVGYGMKRRRFEQLHRKAIGFPAERFDYVGIDDEGDTTEHYAGELKYGYTPFLTAPTGCHPPLSTKRLLRNPYSRYHPYHTSSPELIDLLEWCPAYDSAMAVRENEEDAWKDLKVFEGDLPWRDGAGGTRWVREHY